MKKILLIIAVAAACMAFSCKEQAATIPADAIRDSVARIIAEYPGEVGMALIVDGRDTVTVNNAARYPMMSVFKLHQAIAVCHRLDMAGIALDTMMMIDRRSLDPDTWSPMLADHTADTIALTVGDMLLYTLQQSDNNASNVLFDCIAGVGETDSLISTIIPRESFAIRYSEARMKADHPLAYSNYTSPLGAAMLITAVYRDSIVSAPKQEFLRQALDGCATGTDRIVAPLAGIPGITVGHKTGSGYRNERGQLVAHNDVAYVRLHDGREYALAVFVMDFAGDESQAAECIARISAAVYAALAPK